MSKEHNPIVYRLNGPSGTGVRRQPAHVPNFDSSHSHLCERRRPKDYQQKLESAAPIVPMPLKQNHACKCITATFITVKSSSSPAYLLTIGAIGLRCRSSTRFESFTHHVELP